MSDTLRDLLEGKDKPTEVKPPTRSKVEYAEILRQCADIAEERGEKYGDVILNFQDISNILATMFGMSLNMEEICKVFIATKISREKNAHQEDNLLDWINYTAILLYIQRHDERIHKRMETRTRARDAGGMFGASDPRVLRGGKVRVDSVE